MYDTMLAAKGMGLAGNQVDIPYNLFVMQGPGEEKIFIVNPKVISKSQVQANLMEGCLSAPGEFLTLKERVSWIEIEFQDEFGDRHTRVFKDIHAVCVQHEMDHLLGKSHLQAKSIPRNTRKELAKKWNLNN